MWGLQLKLRGIHFLPPCLAPNSYNRKRLHNSNREAEAEAEAKGERERQRQGGKCLRKEPFPSILSPKEHSHERFSSPLLERARAQNGSRKLASEKERGEGVLALSVHQRRQLQLQLGRRA